MKMNFPRSQTDLPTGRDPESQGPELQREATEPAGTGQSAPSLENDG